MKQRRATVPVVLEMGDWVDGEYCIKGQFVGGPFDGETVHVGVRYIDANTCAIEAPIISRTRPRNVVSA